MPAPVPEPEFRMFGARLAMANGLSHISEQVKGIERAINENTGLAFDLSKTVIESVCKTILSERRIPFGNDDDLPKLFKATTTYLPLLPGTASAEAEVRKSLVQTLSGLHTALQGVCELRNACGYASHGSDGPKPEMEGVQAMLAAQAADAIVGFLHRVHYQERVKPKSTGLTYADHPEFNDYVDDLNDPLKIFDLEFSPSEVLFQVDQGAYRDLLTGFDPTQTSAELGSEDSSSGVAP